MSDPSFQNDYHQGGHPEVLKALVEGNHTYDAGYGLDVYSQQAQALLRKQLGNQKADVHFISGGTQVNKIVASLLKPYEAIIAPTTGHINVHESGAVEAGGHKIIAVATTDGKLTPLHIRQIIDAVEDEHTVIPRAVFIANATELGTMYSLTELKALRVSCRKHKLYLYVDGARLGQALVSKKAHMTLKNMAQLCDAFYIGGTKNGALFGEALVLIHDDFKDNFRNVLKQHGALLAKGKFMGIQFLALFKKGLYMRLATHAQMQAAKLTQELKKQGHRFLVDSETNQIFPVFKKRDAVALQKKYKFFLWKELSNDVVAVRFVTSWSTKNSEIDALLKECAKYEPVQVSK